MSSTLHQPAIDVQAVLHRLGIQPVNSGACYGEWIEHPGGGELISYSPIDGSELARVQMADERDYDAVVDEAAKAFESWRVFPAPKRGQIVREIGDELRAHKDDLGALVTLEMGKILPEGHGEVQEMIDIADFAVGLSRQLYGLTMHSERPGHRMYEQWHPLGIVGVITAFNFPVAVWSWNALIAAVCGDCRALEAVAEDAARPPSPSSTSATGSSNAMAGRASSTCSSAPARAVGERMLRDRRVPLVSLHRARQPSAARSREVVGAAPRPHDARAGRQQRDHRRWTTANLDLAGPRRRVRRRRNRRPALHHHAPPVRCKGASRRQ